MAYTILRFKKDRGLNEDIENDLFGEEHGDLSDEDFKLSKDKAVAQAVLNYVPKIKFKIVEELSDTDRGQGGFGSSGRGL